MTCTIASDRQRLATELLALHLTEAAVAGEVRIQGTGAFRAAPALPDVVVIDHQGVFDPFSLANQVLERSPATRLVLLVEEPSDYLLWKARGGRFSAVLSAADAMPSWAQAFRVTASAFFVAPFARPSDGNRILGKVTRRQMEVFELTVQGLTDGQIGERLGGISASTVEAHRRDLFSRLGCHSWAELVVLAIKAGIVRPHHIRFPRAERRNDRSHAARDLTTA